MCIYMCMWVYMYILYLMFVKQCVCVYTKEYTRKIPHIHCVHVDVQCTCTVHAHTCIYCMDMDMYNNTWVFFLLTQDRLQQPASATTSPPQRDSSRYIHAKLMYTLLMYMYLYTCTVYMYFKITCTCTCTSKSHDCTCTCTYMYVCTCTFFVCVYTRVGCFNKQ